MAVCPVNFSSKGFLQSLYQSYQDMAVCLSPCNNFSNSYVVLILTAGSPILSGTIPDKFLNYIDIVATKFSRYFCITIHDS